MVVRSLYGFCEFFVRDDERVRDFVRVIFIVDVCFDCDIGNIL